MSASDAYYSSLMFASPSSASPSTLAMEMDRLISREELKMSRLAHDDDVDSSSAAHAPSPHAPSAPISAVMRSALFTEADSLSKQNKNQVATAIQQLGRALEAQHGIPGFAGGRSLTDTLLQANEKSHEAAAACADVVHALLRARQADAVERERLERAAERAMHDTSVLEATVERTKETLDAVKRESALSLNKADLTIKEKNDDLSRERRAHEQLKKKAAQTNQRLAQLTLEGKRREKESDKLKERLRANLSKLKVQGAAPALVVTDGKVVSRGPGAPTAHDAAGTNNNFAATSTSGDGDGFHRAVTSSYERKVSELNAENAEMRSELRSMRRHLFEVARLTARPGEGAAWDDADDDMLMNAPVSIVGEKIAASGREAISHIKAAVERMRVHAPGGAASADKRQAAGRRERELEAELVDARELVASQERAIQSALAGRSLEPLRASLGLPIGASPAAPAGAQSPDGHKLSRSEIEKRLRALEVEKSNLMEAARDLDDERTNISQKEEQLKVETSLFSEEKESYRKTLEEWAPGLGAGLFLSKAAETRAQTEAVRKVIGDNVAAAGDTTTPKTTTSTTPKTTTSTTPTPTSTPTPTTNKNKRYLPKTTTPPTSSSKRTTPPSSGSSKSKVASALKSSRATSPGSGERRVVFAPTAVNRS